MAFKYASDIGVDSIPAIKAAMNASGIPHNVVSTYRPGSRTLSGKLSYHARRNAIDSSSSPANMRDLAAWIALHYGPYTLELIHSTGRGYFIHNGRTVSASAYGAAVVSQHYDHVHWAITNSGLIAGNASAGVGGITGQQPVADATAVAYDPQTNNGCMMPVVAAFGILSTSITTGVTLFQMFG